MASCNYDPHLNSKALTHELAKYIYIYGKLHEPGKSKLKGTVFPFFTYIYLALLKGKGVDIARKFFLEFCEHIKIDGFTPHLYDLFQIRTLNEARSHHYFRIFFGKFKLNKQKESLIFLAKCLKMAQCSSLLKTLIRLVVDEHKNVSNCPQSTATSSIVKENTNIKMAEQPTRLKRKDSTSWIEEPGTSSSLKNPDVEPNSYKVDLLHCVIHYGGLEVSCAAINQENTKFASGFQNSTICVGTLDIDTMVESLPRKKAFLKSDDSSITEHYLTSMLGLDHCLTGHRDKITGLAFAPSGLLMSCSDDTTAQAWRMTDFKSVSIYRGHGDQIKDIGVSDNGVYFATASNDCTARLWNFERRIPLINFYHPFKVERLKFGPNCKYLATLSDQRIIQLWTVENGLRMWTIPENDRHCINCLTISPDEKYVTYADDEGFIKVWDLSAQKLYSKGVAHSRPIYDLAYNKNGSIMVSCAGDRRIRLWNAEKSLVPVSKKRSMWNHEKLATYYAANFDPVFLSFCKNDLLITINSKQRPHSSTVEHK